MQARTQALAPGTPEDCHDRRLPQPIQAWLALLVEEERVTEADAVPSREQ